MDKTNLSPQQVFELIIIGVKNGNYDAVIEIAKDCIKQLDLKEEAAHDVAKEG